MRDVDRLDCCVVPSLWFRVFFVYFTVFFPTILTLPLVVVPVSWVRLTPAAVAIVCAAIAIPRAWSTRFCANNDQVVVRAMLHHTSVAWDSISGTEQPGRRAYVHLVLHDGRRIRATPTIQAFKGLGRGRAEFGSILRFAALRGIVVKIDPSYRALLGLPLHDANAAGT